MITKLSRKDIKMLESSVKNNVSKSALEDYLSARNKAETAWKVFRDSLVLSEDGASKVDAKKERKFKAGDKVRVLDTSSPLTASFLCVGDITKVVDYKEDQERKWSNPQQRPVVVEDFISKSNGYFEETALELVEKEKPQRKFKAGDRVGVVRATYPLAYGEDFSIGNVGTVVGYKGKEIPWGNDTKDSRPVVVTNHSSNSWGHFEESTLELATEEEKSPNESRAEIIQRAKEFVKDVETTKLSPMTNPYRYNVKVTFIVNTDKRVVVALLKSISSNKVVAKGVAKCHSEDVFNEHVGKAIALGRVLSKDVSKFENAVQPSRYAVGQIGINSLGASYPFEIIDIGVGLVYKNNFEPYNNSYGDTTKPLNFENKNYKALTIINDTNAQYEKKN